MFPPAHEFDYLRTWESLSDDDLDKFYIAKNVDILRRIICLLGDDNDKLTKISKKNFLDLIKRMNRLYREGSRQLSDAIYKASKYVDEDNHEKAREVYGIFLNSCFSDFYREIAKTQLTKLN